MPDQSGHLEVGLLGPLVEHGHAVACSSALLRRCLLQCLEFGGQPAVDRCPCRFGVSTKSVYAGGRCRWDTWNKSRHAPWCRRPLMPWHRTHTAAQP